MKKFLVAIPMAALLLASCGSKDNSLENILEDKEDFDAAANSWANGNAEDGEQYFFGVQAEVIEVDVKFREIEMMDEMDADAKEIDALLDSTMLIIEESKKAMKQYDGKDWPKQKELNEITIEWFDGIEMLVKDYLRDLAPAMAKPDEDWTDEEIDLYTEYLDAYDEYLDIDERWVEFQHEYAAANGFSFGTETIDVDALVEQDMASEE